MVLASEVQMLLGVLLLAVTGCIPDRHKSQAVESPDASAAIPPLAVARVDDGGEIVMIGDRSLKIGALSKHAISEVARSHQKDVEDCYTDRGGQHPRSAGRVSLAFTIAPTGSVKQVVVAETTLHDPEVEMCLIAAVRAWRFPTPSDGADVSVIYPWTFKPRSRTTPSMP
jgi:TonB family protein